MSEAVLFSGGMDSVAALAAYPNAQPVYVTIGAAYEDRELASIEERGLHVNVVPAGRWLGKQADDVGRVPLRNLLFAVVAAAATGADTVVLGATAGETSPDKSRRFARLAGAAMSAAEARRIRLAMPFRGVTKTELVRRMLHDTHGAERLRVEDTLRACPSCYSATLPSGVTGCGQCMSCVRRWVAMSLNGIEERYVLNPWQRKLLQPNATWLRYVMRTPVRDWPGVLAVNQELWRAVRAATRRGL